MVIYPPPPIKLGAAADPDAFRSCRRAPELQRGL